ncbi:MAG TPA: MgtC/SapB family protein [Gammaproteobacteria bacterium]|nr:MgtC/SapB family protein [Gammaproteobacteria bacterium]
MSDFTDANQIILLGIALAIGLLIGIERGWKSRAAQEGKRIAGLRTFGLTGLLGGAAGMLSQYIDAIAFGFIFLGFSVAVTMTYVKWRRFNEDISITSLVALLLTFILGVLAALDHVNLAASAAVITAMLLRFKDVLHGWLKKLERQELHAALQLLLISVVLLPILPDQGYGPWQALNPYEVWWMVVLIAGISFIGYFSVKIAGPKKGLLFTAIATGLASSTALTLHFSRLSIKQKNMKNLLAAGVLLACGIMFLRIVLIASLINPALFSVLIIPLSTMTLVSLISAGIYWQKNIERLPELTPLINPLELKTALLFGAFLALIILAGKAAIHFYGDTGVYMLATISGIADVDPINLTLSRMSTTGLSLHITIMAILLAAASNTILKGILAMVVGGTAFGLRVLLPLLAAIVIGWLSSTLPGEVNATLFV